ncbi:hypothetical protein X801_02064 [Opisthorchis viverrini]|uniref:Uncharacterized protein n=1 Tax=Opisthorchis viverrini TaxID=6198 RepID=A0A1S8X5S4_OPIVI|nr:hypothetical protein X801_02064 [Opisthorchis viverrini]
MSDVPPDAPASCPGTQSEMAGKTSACDGCPNQAACSSGQANLPLSEREPDVIANIHNRLGRIHNRILILSGKGGVGKSSLAKTTLNLSMHIARSDCWIWICVARLFLVCWAV